MRTKIATIKRYASSLASPAPPSPSQLSRNQQQNPLSHFCLLFVFFFYGGGGVKFLSPLLSFMNYYCIFPLIFCYHFHATCFAFHIAFPSHLHRRRLRRPLPPVLPPVSTPTSPGWPRSLEAAYRALPPLTPAKHLRGSPRPLPAA